MRKIILFAITVVLTFSMVGCTSHNTQSETVTEKVSDTQYEIYIRYA